MWEPATCYCTSMLCSVDSCQSKVSADQFKMSVLRAQVMYFLEIYRWQVSSFQLIAGSTLIGFLYCNIFSLPGASPLASAKSVKNLLDDPNSFRRTNWARRRTFHELNSLSLVSLMKSSYFSLDLSENSRGYFIFKITGLVGQFWLVVNGLRLHAAENEHCWVNVTLVLFWQQNLPFICKTFIAVEYCN